MRSTLLLLPLLLACASTSPITPMARAAEPSPFSDLVPALSRIQGLSVAPKLFENDGRTSLGITYDYAQEFELVRGTSWIQGEVKASGNVAFRSSLNPDDFLSTRLGFRFTKTMGGTVKNDAEAAAAFQALALRASEIETEADLDAFMRSEEVREYLNFLRPQLSLFLDLDGGLEADQRFTRKQWVLGTGLYAELNLWGESRKANLFDYPFALVRYLTGQGEFEPLGSTVPALSVGLDLVSPRAEDERFQLLGNKDGYLRARAELGFRTELARTGDQVLFANATWRVYQELGVEDVVEEADLHRFSHVVVTVSSSTGVFVSYTDGRLPMDAENDQTYALGWEFNW